MDSGDDNTLSRFIMRIDRRTGEEISGPTDPDELLIHAHRDYHPLEVTIQFLASRAIQLTGNEGLTRRGLRLINTLGILLAKAIGAAIGSTAIEKQTKRLLGVIDRDSVFQFRTPVHLSEQEVATRVNQLQREARAALRTRGRKPQLHVLLTGATGFVGKEVLCQAARDLRIAQVVAVVRPETIRNRKTGEVMRILSPQERGDLLLQRLHITGARAEKFRFIAGDIEKPHLGIAPEILDQLRQTVTHVIHCAASVSFDDPYDASYQANVLGCRNALNFSLGLQQAQSSPFVSYIAIETSYIHGRKRHSIAQEGTLDFPRHFYNNRYCVRNKVARRQWKKNSPSSTWHSWPLNLGYRLVMSEVLPSSNSHQALKGAFSSEPSKATMTGGGWRGSTG